MRQAHPAGDPGVAGVFRSAMRRWKRFRFGPAGRRMGPNEPNGGSQMYDADAGKRPRRSVSRSRVFPFRRSHRFGLLISLTEAIAFCVALLGCASLRRSSPVASAARPSASHSYRVIPGRVIEMRRLTGTVKASQSITVQVPQLADQSGQVTLIHLVANGARVHKGDVLAEFDRTAQLQHLQDERAQYDDLQHQVLEKMAQNRSDAELRNADLQQALADAAKAALEVRKGPVLSDLDRRKNEIELRDAQEHAASLKKSSRLKDQSAAADLRNVELKRDRARAEMERAAHNAGLLIIRAPLDGMVALKDSWRNGSFGHPQEGDTMWPGGPLLQLFNPSRMQVEVPINEADLAVVRLAFSPAMPSAATAVVHLDAYPGAGFAARFREITPTASSASGSSVRTFTATCDIQQSDPRLMPDLSAALDVKLPASVGPAVPRSALGFAPDGSAFVFAFAADGSVRQRTVQIEGFDDRIAIVQGVTDGERLRLDAEAAP
jgi:HlyD family secretion protein